MNLALRLTLPVGSRLASPASALLGAETSGMAMDFISSASGDLFIRDPSGALSYSGKPFASDGGKITFTRASTATRVNVSGKIETVASGTPRLDYDPVSVGVCRGFLVEEQRTNLLLRSAEFDDASWTKTNSSVTANAVASPDDTTSADKFIPGSGQTAANVVQSVSVAGATAYTVSVYVKAAEQTSISVASDITGTLRTNVFDLSAVTATPGTGWTAFIADVGGGWYRCMCTATSDVAASKQFQISNSGTSWTGNGTSGVYIWGAQLEAGTFASSYIPTTTASATRAADLAQIDTASFPYSASVGAFTASLSRVVNTAQVRGPCLLTVASDSTNAIFIRQTGSNGNNGRIVTSNVVQAAFGTLTTLPGIYKVAMTWAANDAAYCQDGGTVETDNTVTLPPAATLLAVGFVNSTNNIGNGHVRQITYIPRRIPNTDLQWRTA